MLRKFLSVLFFVMSCGVGVAGTLQMYNVQILEKESVSPGDDMFLLGDKGYVECGADEGAVQHGHYVIYANDGAIGYVQCDNFFFDDVFSNPEIISNDVLPWCEKDFIDAAMDYEVLEVGSGLRVLMKYGMNIWEDYYLVEGIEDSSFCVFCDEGYTREGNICLKK